jgi:hypothetical protein
MFNFSTTYTLFLFYKIKKVFITYEQNSTGGRKHDGPHQFNHFQLLCRVFFSFHWKSSDSCRDFMAFDVVRPKIPILKQNMNINIIIRNKYI